MCSILIESAKCNFKRFLQNKRITLSEWVRLCDFYSGKNRGAWIVIMIHHTTLCNAIFFLSFFCYSFRTLITKLQSYLFTFHSNDSAHELEKQKLAWAANEREKWSCTHIHARMCMCIVWSGGKTAVFGRLIRISSLLDCCVAFFMLR